MATTQFTRPSTRAAGGVNVNRRAVVGVLVATMVAGMMFGMMQMIVEAIIGHGFWSPLRYIASVFTHGADTDPSFAIGPVIVGLGGHMMNSVILGAVFAGVFWKLTRNPVVLVMAGMAWGTAIYFFMWWGVIPTIDPAMKLLNAPWFFGSHLMYGMVLGLGVAAAQRLSQRRLLE
jgi:predicted secreted protein